MLKTVRLDYTKEQDRILFNKKSIENYNIFQMVDIKDYLTDALKEVDKYLKHN